MQYASSPESTSQSSIRTFLPSMSKPSVQTPAWLSIFTRRATTSSHRKTLIPHAAESRRVKSSSFTR